MVYGNDVARALELEYLLRTLAVGEWNHAIELWKEIIGFAGLDGTLRSMLLER